MLFRLQDEAPQSGGEVILLNGNHELMNMQGDFRYATKEDTRLFGGGIRERQEAFGPDGWPGRRLRERNVAVALVGRERGLDSPVVYVHGGLLPGLLRHGGAGGASPAGARSDASVSGASLLAADVDADGASAVDALNAAIREQLVGKDVSLLSADESAHFGDEGPFWTRRLALGPERDACPELEATLRALGAGRMVVGHTAQTDGRIHHRCGGRLVLADTVISDAYEGKSHPSAVLAAPGGQAFALYPARDRRDREPLPTVVAAQNAQRAP